jgi:retron-type reverse transcriptase
MYDDLTDAKHGFRKRRSCDTQLILTIHDLAKSIDEKSQTDLILLDFAKAFDKVSHKLLLHKAEHYGINGDTLDWIKDFLSQRTQQVVIEGQVSSEVKVTSGVPQGSVLGPLLFIIFINDLPSCVKSSVSRLFADDCVLYKQISSASDASLLQKDLDALQKWERTWLMEFHPSKCQTVRVTNKRRPICTSYTIHGEELETVPSAKYLHHISSSDAIYTTMGFALLHDIMDILLFTCTKMCQNSTRDTLCSAAYRV